MIPDLQSSLICDDVRQERNGKFMLIGLFDAIHAERLPVAFAKMCLVTRWCSGEGTFTQRSRIVHPDQKTVLAAGQDVQVNLPSPEAAATSVDDDASATSEVAQNIGFEADAAVTVGAAGTIATNVTLG